MMNQHLEEKKEGPVGGDGGEGGGGVFNLLCYFFCLSLEVLGESSASSEVNEAHDGYRAAMDTLSNTTLLTIEERKRRDAKEEKQSLTRASVKRSCPSHLGSAARSNNSTLYTHMSAVFLFECFMCA